MTRVRHHRRQLMLAAAAMLVAVVGCGDDDDDAAAVPPPDAGAYVAALAPFLPVADPEDPPNVFVAPFEQTLALDVQVAIIAAIGDGYDLRFVDNAAAAVDADAVGRPVRDDGLLIVLGTIPAEPPYVVRVEQYRRQDDVSAQLVTLVWTSDHWDVAAQERVQPEAVIVNA